MNYPLGDSTIHVQSYNFTNPNFDQFNPKAVLTESGEMVLLTRSDLYIFDGKSLRKIPATPQITSSSFNHIGVSEEGWMWMVNRSRELRFPITNTSFYDFTTNEFQSRADFFKGTVLENIDWVNIFSLDRKKIVINTIDGEIYVYARGEIRALELERKNLLIGKGPNFEIITRERTEDGILINIIDLKNDSLRQLPMLNSNKEVVLSYIKGGFLYAILGFDGQDGLFIYDLEKPNQEWKYNSNHLGLHCYGLEQGTYYFGYPDGTEIHKVQKHKLIHSEYDNFLHEILSPGIPLKKISTTLGEWKYNRTGLHFIWKSKNRMNGIIGNNFLSGKSVRKLRFQGDSLLTAATHSGFFEMDLSAFPEKSLKFNRDPELFECQNYYCLNFYFQKDQKIFLVGEEIIVYDFQDKSCKEYLAPDGHKLEIWGLETLAPNRLILGSVKGPLFLGRSKNDAYRITRMNYSNGYDNYNKVGINRIKRKNESDTLMFCTNEGLVLGKWENAAQFNIQVLGIINPDDIVYDAEFLDANSLFLATHHSGLIWLNPSDNFNTVFEYNRNNYFRTNTTHNIQTDRQGRLWIGSNKGLYLIHPESRQIRDINSTDGFINDEFNRLSSARSPSGLLAFGGIDGVSVFDPDSFDLINKEKAISLYKIILYDEDGTKTYIYPNEKDSLIEINVGTSIEKAGFVFEGGLLQNQAELFIRQLGSNDFWIPLKEGIVNIQELENPAEDYELKIILPSGKIILPHTSLSFNLTPSYWGLIIKILVIPVLFLCYLIFRRWGLAAKSKPKAKAEDLENHLNTTHKNDTNQGTGDNLEYEENKLHRFQKEMDQIEQSHLLHYHKQNDSFTRKLNELITENMDSKNLSVNFIAQKIHQSPRQLHRKVVARTGLSPQKYLTFKKLVWARQLINSKPELNISEVAYQCGFTKPSYFSKLFKTLYGLSPSKYKEKIQQ